MLMVAGRSNLIVVPWAEPQAQAADSQGTQQAESEAEAAVMKDLHPVATVVVEVGACSLAVVLAGSVHPFVSAPIRLVLDLLPGLKLRLCTIAVASTHLTGFTALR